MISINVTIIVTIVIIIISIIIIITIIIKGQPAGGGWKRRRQACGALGELTVCLLQKWYPRGGQVKRLNEYKCLEPSWLYATRVSCFGRSCRPPRWRARPGVRPLVYYAILYHTIPYCTIPYPTILYDGGALVWLAHRPPPPAAAPKIPRREGRTAPVTRRELPPTGPRKRGCARFPPKPLQGPMPCRREVLRGFGEGAAPPEVLREPGRPPGV